MKAEQSKSHVVTVLGCLNMDTCENNCVDTQLQLTLCARARAIRCTAVHDRQESATRVTHQQFKHHDSCVNGFMQGQFACDICSSTLFCETLATVKNCKQVLNCCCAGKAWIHLDSAKGLC